MEENTDIVVNKSGEPTPTPTPDVKNDPFAILETEPVFKSDDTGSTAKTEVDLNLTITPQEQADKDKLEADNKVKDAEALVAKAKELSLPETATPEEIKAAETKIADELKAKAVELGLPETATKEEISAAELKKTETEGFVTEDEVKIGLLGAEDGTWKALMLAKGLEVPADYKEENGFDVYEKAETAKWQAEIEKAKTEAQESVFSKLKPDVATALELANAIPDLTLEQIITPTLTIDNYLKLGKEELIREDIRLSNPEYTPEMIDVEMQKIKDSNQLDLLDSKIRIDLNKEKVNIQNFQQQKIQEYQTRQLQEKSTAEKAKIEQVIKALDRVPSFLDKNLNQTDRQFLANKINSGAVNDLLNNPEKLARAITMLEFHDKGMQSYENRVREKLLLEQKKTLHNTPTTVKTGGANQVVTKKPITNQFDILKEEKAFSSE
jgi:hypothetical protein